MDCRVLYIYYIYILLSKNNFNPTIFTLIFLRYCRKKIISTPKKLVLPSTHRRTSPRSPLASAHGNLHPASPESASATGYIAPKIELRRPENRNVNYIRKQKINALYNNIQYARLSPCGGGGGLMVSDSLPSDEDQVAAAALRTHLLSAL
jgi:hypothetical protein